MQLPPKKVPEREMLIVNAVSEGRHWPLTWSVVRTAIPGHAAVFLTMSDALRIDIETTDVAGKTVEGEGIRVSVTARGAQVIADLLDCSLLTGKLADAIWDQADVHVPPQTMVHTKDDTLRMMDTAWMIRHSYKIDALLPGLSDVAGVLTENEAAAFDVLPNFSALVSTVGKHWVIDEELAHQPRGTACNYGWPIPKDGKPLNNATRTGRVIQPLSYKHNDTHTDYSQTLVLVSTQCLVDGVRRDLRDVLQDPATAGLASHRGVMTYLRQKS